MSLTLWSLRLTSDTSVCSDVNCCNQFVYQRGLDLQHHVYQLDSIVETLITAWLLSSSAHTNSYSRSTRASRAPWISLPMQGENANNSISVPTWKQNMFSAVNGSYKLADWNGLSQYYQGCLHKSFTTCFTALLLHFWTRCNLRNVVDFCPLVCSQYGLPSQGYFAWRETRAVSIFYSAFKVI